MKPGDDVNPWFSRLAQAVGARLGVGASKREALSQRLMEAVIEDSVAGALSALREGADPNARGGDPDFPLNKAVKHAGLGVCEALLDAGADIDAVSGFGRRALHDALEESRGSDEKVRLLLSRGASPNPMRAHDIAPLWVAMNSRADLALARALLDHGANPNLPMSESLGGYLYCCLNNDRMELAQLLVERGADASRALAAGGRDTPTRAWLTARDQSDQLSALLPEAQEERRRRQSL